MTVTTFRLHIGSAITDRSAPSDQPIGTWIDQQISELADLHDDPGLRQDTIWTLANGAHPIRRDQTLDDAGITDGDTVFLRSVAVTERYRPLTEDAADALTMLNTDPVFGRADVLTWLACITAVVLVGAAGAALFGWITHHRIWWGPGTIALGLACLTLAAMLRRREQPQLAFTFGVGAIANLATGAALSVPLPYGAHWLGAPQLAAAASVIALCMILWPGGPTRWRAWTGFAATAGIIIFLAAVGVAFGQAHWVWPLLVLVGLLLVKNTGRITMKIARIALPPIPAPGQEISLDALNEPVDVSPEWDRIQASAPPSMARLTDRSALTRRLPAGLTAAAVTATTVGTFMLFQQGHFLPHTATLCALIVGILLLRVRITVNRHVAWGLLSGAAMIILGVVAKILWWWPAWAPLMIAVAVVVLVAIVMSVLATAAVRLTQIQKRWLEHLDMLCVVGTLFLLAWASGLLDVLRNIPIGG